MVASGLKRIEARFFVTDVGREPVREWLFELDRNDRRQIGRDLMTLEFGWPIGMPLSRSMGAGLHELRSSISGGRECRLFFYVDRHERLVLCTPSSSAAERHQSATSTWHGRGCGSINGVGHESET
jgi:hypothetical protein